MLNQNPYKCFNVLNSAKIACLFWSIIIFPLPFFVFISAKVVFFVFFVVVLLFNCVFQSKPATAIQKHKGAVGLIMGGKPGLSQLVEIHLNRLTLGIQGTLAGTGFPISNKQRLISKHKGLSENRVYSQL